MNWSEIRNQFNLSKEYIHLAQMLLASHPLPVRIAIENHRKNLDEHTVHYYESNYVVFEQRARKAAADYMLVDPEEVALTDSATMALGLLYTGLKLKVGDEILSSTHDHYSSEKAMEYGAQKNGASIRRIDLYDDSETCTKEDICNRIKKAIKNKTKIIALTWVHSCTGVKIPVKEIAAIIHNENKLRTAENQIYFCLDGVHAFGVEDENINDLACDFFATSTHKWLFGPRGTGLLWAKRSAWHMITPTIPSFSDLSYYTWTGELPPQEINFSDLHMPGGFHAFEHQWALNEAFYFHQQIGKTTIKNRTHQLNNRLKHALKEIDGLKLHTPLSETLSSGITCFELKNKTAKEVNNRLYEKKIIASITPYKTIYPRLSPCIINTEEEIDNCIKTIKEIAAKN